MAFFIIPVSLTSTELVVILFLFFLLFILRKFPGLLPDISRVVRNLKDVFKED